MFKGYNKDILHNGETNMQEDNSLLEFSGELTEEKVTEKLKGWNARWETYSQDLYPKLESFWNMYRNMQYSLEGVTVKIPQIFTTIEVELPHLLNNIFAQSNVVDATAKYFDSNQETTYKVKNYINKLIKDICDGRRKTELIIKNMLIYGYSVIKATWNLAPDKDIDPVTKKVVNVNSAHPDFYLVDNFSFAFDPDFTGQKVDEIEWVRERIFISKNKMKEMRDNGECGPFSDSDLQAGEDKGKTSRNPNKKKDTGTFYDEFWARLYYKEPVMEDRPVLDETGAPVIDEMGVPVVENVEVDKKTVSKEFRIWLLANNKIVKFEENIYGYKPFTVVRAYSNPFEFIGMGEPEVIGTIANQLSLTNYQAGKMAKKIGQSVTWVGPTAGISPYNLERIESGVVFLKDLNAVKSEQSFDPNNLRVLMEFSQYLNSEVESISGVTKFLQGTDIGDMTATQAALISQNSTNRLADKLVHLQQDFIVPLATMFFLMNKQLLESPVDFIDNNNNLITLTPEDFYGNYIWTSTSPVTIANKALQLQQNGALLQQLVQGSMASMQNPMGKPYGVDQVEFIKKYIAPNANIPDMGNIIITQEMIPQPPMGPTDPTTAGVPVASPVQASPTPMGGPGQSPLNAGQSPEMSAQIGGLPPSAPHPAGPSL